MDITTVVPQKESVPIVAKRDIGSRVVGPRVMERRGKHQNDGKGIQLRILQALLSRLLKAKVLLTTLHLLS